MMMSRWLLALMVCGACFGAATAHARVWSGVDLMHVESADGTNMCALTFDDGPAGHSSRLLDVLEAEGIHATFFMLGRQVLAHPDLVRRAALGGHDIGIHSQTHPNMKKLNMDKQAEELIRPLLALQDLGIAPRWFRPPYGNMNASLKELAAYLGLSIIIWSHDSKDWKRTRSDYANMETATGAPTPEGAMRGVFLFHDTSARTAEDLPEIINILRARGCQRFVTMSEFTGETERPMPSRQDEALYTQAGQSLTKVLTALQAGPHTAGVELLSSMVAAVTHNAPLPDFAAAGLRTPPFTGQHAVADASGVISAAGSASAGTGLGTGAPQATTLASAPVNPALAANPSAVSNASAAANVPPLPMTRPLSDFAAPHAAPAVFRFAPCMHGEDMATAGAPSAGSAAATPQSVSAAATSSPAESQASSVATASAAGNAASEPAAHTAGQRLAAELAGEGAASSTAPQSAPVAVTPSAAPAGRPVLAVHDFPVNAPIREAVAAAPAPAATTAAAPQLLASPVTPPAQ